MDWLPFDLGSVPLYLLALFTLYHLVVRLKGRRQSVPDVKRHRARRSSRRPDEAPADCVNSRNIVVDGMNGSLRLRVSEWDAVLDIARVQSLTVNELLSLIRKHAPPVDGPLSKQLLGPLRTFLAAYVEDPRRHPEDLLQGALQAVARTREEKRRVTVSGKRITIALTVGQWLHLEEIAEAERMSLSSLLTVWSARMDLEEADLRSAMEQELPAMAAMYRQQMSETRDAEALPAGIPLAGPGEGEGEAPGEIPQDNAGSGSGSPSR